MKHESKFSQEQQHAETHQAQQQQAGREFAGAEELLRHDAAQTAVPPEIEERLKRTLRDAVLPRQPGWLTRMFGKRKP